MVENLHGVAVTDPYRWLEDGDSPEVRAWTAAQNARTRAVLDALPERASLHRQFLDLLAVGTVGAPVVARDRVFTLEREGDLEQAVVVVRSAVETEGGPPTVVVDPAGLAADAAAAVDWFAPSPDGRLLAYGVSQAGSEHGTLRIVEVDTARVLPDAIGPVRHPSVAWLPDGSAFAYSRLPQPGTVPEGEEGYWEKVFWHRLGEDPAEDELVLGEDLDRTALPAATISPDGRWLAVHVHLMPTRTDVVLIDRHTGRRSTVVEGEEASTWCQLLDDRLVAVTNLAAPRGRVVTAALDRPEVEHWETVVPEGSAVVDAAVVAGRSMLVATTEHAVSRLHRYDLDDPSEKEEEVVLPEAGSLVGLDADPAHERAFLSFTSFARPPALWRWSPEKPLETWSHHRSPIDPGRYRVDQVFYPSTAGMSVPMFLVRARTTVPSPDTPAVLTGYGGFAIASTPAFGPGIVAWCDRGGIFALAGIRGGSEYGEDWHRAGMRHNKQQVFDDFISAADYLVQEEWTSRERLAVRGGSNGGLLVGAVVTQRPALCRAAVCAVPLLDMLRYHRFLIGALWVPEYGDPEDAEDFATLYRYSPYHRVEDGTPYPALLITTAESDSRVDPMHARKFAARIQAATTSPPDHPVLLRVESRAGHGLGKPRWKQADELADTWAFLTWQLGPSR